MQREVTVKPDNDISRDCRGRDDNDRDGSDRDDANQLCTSDCWPIFESYFELQGCVRHHLQSCNSFFEHRAQNVISEQPDVEITLEPPEDPVEAAKFVPTTYIMQYNQLHLRKPFTKEADGTETLLLPRDARLRSLTYAVSCYVDITLLKITNRNTEHEQRERRDAPRVYFGNIPVMVRSSYCHLGDATKQEACEAGECEYDQGGYYIINGLEKIFVGQEKLPDNEVYVYAKTKPPYTYAAQIRSIGAHTGRSSASAMLIGLMRNNKKMQVQMPQVRQPIPLYVMFCALGVTERDDIEQLLLCGGSRNDGEMLRALQPTLQEAHLVRQQEVALDYIGKRAAIVSPTRDKRIESARQILGRELLPHLGGADVTLEKACFLGRMARKLLLCALQRVPVDDRDNYGSKRVELAGPLLESLFKQILRQMTDEIRKSVYSSVAKRKPVLFALAVKPTILTNKMRYSFATGNWGMQRPGAAGVRTGVTQSLSRQSLATTLSHSRRIDQQIARDGKVATPRLLHSTQFGSCCPSETPEGSPCGLVKNFSIVAGVTTLSRNVAGIAELLDEFGIAPLLTEQRDRQQRVRQSIVSLANTKVLLDCRWVGTTTEPRKLVEFLRHCRRTQRILTQQTAVVYVPIEDEIRISVDSGRVMRPLYIVDPATRRLKLTKATLSRMTAESPQQLWANLCSRGFIEYVDVQEQRNTLIAMFAEDVVKLGDKIDYTHCELHPATMLGVTASLIPFPDHNQSPRNTYEAAMSKQSMSIPMTNYQKRLDTAAYCLNYPQQPLVQTHFSRLLNFNELPSGVVCIVAIICMPGENEEDALVMNLSSVQRGLFRSTSYRTYQDRERADTKPPSARKRPHPDSAQAQAQLQAAAEATADTKRPPVYKREQFERPDANECVGAHNRDYSHLDSDGLAVPGLLVSARHVIVGKTAPMPKQAAAAATAATTTTTTGAQNQKQQQTRIKRDCSTTLRANEHDARIDCVMLTDAPDGTRMAKVRTRIERVPQIGDKFSSMHGQKGTVGSMRRHEDMPWTTSGIVPDIVINAHCMPSRMTIGQLIEMLMGKAAAMLGEIGDGTPFSSLTVEQIENVVHSCGMQRHGNEVMYSGASGEQLEAQIFMGPTFYQRLNHLSAVKVHGRAHGPKTALTRQPVEGRGRDGGLRFGEMERDCAVAYGAAAFTNDRLQTCSDQFQAPVCRRCGLFAIDDAQSGELFCKRCNDTDSVERVNMPYAHKLLAQELTAMGIAPRAVLPK